MSEANKRETLLPDKIIEIIEEQAETIEFLSLMNKQLVELLTQYMTIEELENAFLNRDYTCDIVPSVTATLTMTDVTVRST